MRNYSTRKWEKKEKQSLKEMDISAWNAAEKI